MIAKAGSQNILRSALKLLAFISISLPALLLAQSDRGTITGTVSDPGGAVIPNAAISARNTETGAVYDTVTTSTGNYTLPSLPAAVYDLTISSAGFSKYVQRGITVQVVQTARIDVILKIGSATESVEISADAALLKTESAEQSQVITGDKINELPLSYANGLRSPIAFAQLAPGTRTTADGGGAGLRVNGLPNESFKVLMDGQDITSGIDPSHLSESQPSVEALQEVSLQSSNFAAEFGQVAGGLVNFTSRSGTNQFHGSGYEYYTNEFLNAGRAFTNNGNGSLVRPRNRNNNYGFTVGGPIIIPKVYNGKDKTFFFFNFEQFRTSQIASGTLTTVPTAAYRQGDFSSALTNKVLGTDPLGRPILENQIYDPATERTVNGSIVRDPFPGNIIPPSRIDPVAAKIQALIPAPTNAQLINNLAIGDALNTSSAIPSIKVDQNVGLNSKFSFYWGNWRNDVNKNNADGLPFPVSPARQYQTRTNTYRLNFDQTIRPTLLLHLGVGEMRYYHLDSTPPSTLAYDAVTQLGLVGSATTPSGFPQITGLSTGTAQGGMSAVIGPTNAGTYYNDKPTSIGSLTWVRGNHTYKFGGEWHKDIWSDVNQGGSQGIYSFSAAETGLPYLTQTTLNGGLVGFPYASFLLGAVDTASVKRPQDPQLRKNSYGVYIQDTWKVTRKLTLDYGIRWDYETALSEIHDRLAIFAPTVSNPSAGGLLGATQYDGYGPNRCNCSFTDTYPFALGPRLGVAYQLTPKTVVRGGWGLVYGPTANTNYLTGTAIVGVGYNILNFTNPSYGDPALQLKNGLQYNPASLYVASLDPGIRPSPGQINSPPYYIDRSGGRPSRINQWNISLQREITKDLVIEAAYVGNRGAWLQADAMLNLNANTIGRLAQFGFNTSNPDDYKILTSPWNSAQAQARGITAPYAGYPAGLTVAQALRPYPQFGNITSKWVARGNSWYDSLQTKVTKRYSHGLTGTVSFTWQKELNLGAIPGEGYTPVAVNDVLNRDQNKYISGYSQPLVLATSLTYQIPAFGENRILRTVLRDWTVGGVFRYASGLPIQAPIANNGLSSVLFRNTFANRVPGQPLFLKDPNCHCIDPNKDFVLNPAAWSDPAQGQWGTSAAYYNDYRYQRRPSEQISVGRLFRLRERMSLQVRAEFFNAFNRAEMNDPVSTNALLTQARNTSGASTGGFGFVNSGSLYSAPRQGQLLARFQF